MTVLVGEVGYSITVEIELIAIVLSDEPCVELYKRSLRQVVDLAQVRLLPPHLPRAHIGIESCGPGVS
jgi:hypothetical protein